MTSYIVVNKESGQAVLEFWGEVLTRHINTDKYEVVSVLAYLQALNRRIKGGQP